MCDANGLVVCTTCRHDRGTDAKGSLADGERLSMALRARAIPHRRHRCLAACTRACAVVLHGSTTRWSFVLGGLHPDRDLDALITMLDLWRQAPDGMVPWRARPEVIRLNTLARIPPMETTP